MKEFIKYIDKEILDLTDEELEFDTWVDGLSKERENREKEEAHDSKQGDWLGSYMDKIREREAKIEEEILAMSDEELKQRVREYPSDTPEYFERIGVENWWDAGFPDVVHEPTELERAFALRLFVYEERCFIRLGYVKEVREGENSIQLRLRFIPAGRLATSGPTELSVRVDKDENLVTIPEILGTGQQMLHFRPEYIEQVLAGWHQEWMV